MEDSRKVKIFRDVKKFWPTPLQLQLFLLDRFFICSPFLCIRKQLIRLLFTSFFTIYTYISNSENITVTITGCFMFTVKFNKGTSNFNVRVVSRLITLVKFSMINCCVNCWGLPWSYRNCVISRNNMQSSHARVYSGSN